MRTDSTHLSDDAVAMCRDYIHKKFGARYLPEQPLRYSAREGAQEAHEAIRPTDVATSSNDLQNMERDAERLYALIWQHFVACQMPPAQYLSSLIAVGAGDFELRTKGRIMQFDGYLRVLTVKEEDVVLPPVQVGETLTLDKLDPDQHFTKPVAPVHGGQSGQGVGEARNWPPFYLCGHHFDNPGAWLRQSGESPFLCAEDGGYCR